VCGILGAISGGGRPVEAPLFLKQLDTLAHRGPDGYGVLLVDARTGRPAVVYNRAPADQGGAASVALGHRRLSILDLSPEAAQPMADAQGRYWVTFNGEIYNFQELRRELEARGHVFRTDHSDTEVLLHAFMEWGEGCLARLRGMFAFAALDLGAGRLFLARDRLGKKPLYYRAGPDGFRFASELKALLADPGVPRRLDPVSLAQYLVYNYVPAPRTIYRDVAKLPAAHCAWVALARPDRVETRRYWTLRFEPDETRGLEDWAEEFQAVFDEAVRLRMASDVPLGALLSGGIDSTLVVRAMSRMARQPVRTFSVGVGEDGEGELPWARQTARRYGTEHHEEIIRPDAVSLLLRLASVYDEPFADASALPTYCVFETARRHVTVALTGDGGDELFAGYKHYDVHRRLGVLDWLPAPLRRLVFGLGACLWPDNLVGRGRLALLSQDERGRYRELRARSEGLRFLAPDVRRSLLADARLHDVFDDAWERAPEEPVSRAQYLDMSTYLPEDVLVKVDRASMAHSVEARCPLLDHRVVELAARIPVRFKYVPERKKLLLKHLLEPDLGRAFVDRPKTGFGLPRDHWFRGELAPFVGDRLLSADTPLPPEIDRRAAARMIRSYHRGNRNLSRYVWNLLMLAAWVEVAHGSSHE
jgi:asparagine synthase (glutamine-hydrolysing)